jgi:multiple sugar transport system permease protein
MTSTTVDQKTTPITHETDVPEVSSEQKRALFRRRLKRASTYLLALIIAVWILLPIWLIGIMAFSSTDAVYGERTFFPTDPSTETIERFLEVEGIVGALERSVIVAVITLVLSTALAVPAGYAVSRYIFPGRDAVMLGILAVRAFPIVVLAVPLAVNFIEWGIYNTVWAVALLHTALVLPTAVLIIASVFASVPYELEEAARVFGCSPAQAFRRVVVPLVIPGITAAAILTFVTSWNEVFAAVILATTNRTLPAMIVDRLYRSTLPFKFAGGFMLLIPSLIFIFIIRRYLFNMWGQVSK